MNQSDMTAALICAAGKGRLKLVQTLLNEGACALARRHGETALLRASVAGRLDVVNLLLDRTVNNSNCDLTNDAATAYILAATYGHTQIVQTFLKWGVDINSSRETGETALFRASAFGHIEVVELLVDNGANISATRTSDECHAITRAVSEGHVEIVEFLIKRGADMNLLNSQGWSLLALASNFGKLEVIKMLLDCGVNIDGTTNDSEKAIHRAIIAGYCDIAKYLIRRGADVRAVRKGDGCTALHQAAYRGLVDIVGLLIKGGAEVNAVDRRGSVALHSASYRNRVSVVKLLLNSGATIDAAEMDGNTALITAAERGHFEIVVILLERGANVHAENNDGESAIRLAARAKHGKIVRLLWETGAEFNEQISQFQ